MYVAFDLFILSQELILLLSRLRQLFVASLSEAFNQAPDQQPGFVHMRDRHTTSPATSTSIKE
jgi:hypothetical protein